MPLYDDIMASLNELIEHEAGKDTQVVEHRLSVLDVPTFTPEQIRSIRANANMTQAVFAACIGVTARSVKAWESGRSKPDGAARRILGLMQSNSRFADDTGIITR